MRLLAGLLLITLFAAPCRQKPNLPVPAALAGIPVDLPVRSEFPCPGMQWTYEVHPAGFPESEDFPVWLVYRFLYSDQKKRLWTNIFYYAGKSEADGTYEQVENGYVFTHPPRSYGFRFLEWAPFPIATPGKAGAKKRKLVLGPGW